MKITTTRFETIPVHEIAATRCDVCGRTTTDIPEWSANKQTEITNETLILSHQGNPSAGTETEIDLCPACWQRVVDWLRASGCEIRELPWVV